MSGEARMMGYVLYAINRNDEGKELSKTAVTISSDPKSANRFREDYTKKYPNMEFRIDYEDIGENPNGS